MYDPQLGDTMSTEKRLQHKIDGLIHTNKHLEDKVNELRITRFKRFNDEENWIWDNTSIECNHIESLVCPVSISPSDLMDLINTDPRLKYQLTQPLDVLVRKIITEMQDIGLYAGSSFEGLRMFIVSRLVVPSYIDAYLKTFTTYLDHTELFSTEMSSKVFCVIKPSGNIIGTITNSDLSILSQQHMYLTADIPKLSDNTDVHEIINDYIIDKCVNMSNRFEISFTKRNDDTYIALLPASLQNIAYLKNKITESNLTNLIK